MRLIPCDYDYHYNDTKANADGCVGLCFSSFLCVLHFQETIRQSKESKLDEAGRMSIKRSLENVNRIIPG